MMNLDGLAYSNGLKHIHPGEKALFALMTMFMILFFSSVLLSILIIGIMGSLLIWRAGIPGRLYLRLMALPFSFLFLSITALLLSFAGESQGLNWLLHIRILGMTMGITQEGWDLAAPLFFKSLASVSCLYFLSLTTPAVEITGVLRKLKIPELFIELMELIYRFIFVLLKTADEIYISQSSRWGYATFRNSLSSFGGLTGALMLRSLDRSQQLFTALSARGYTGSLKVLVPETPVSVRNLILIFAFELLLASIGLLERWF